MLRAFRTVLLVFLFMVPAHAEEDKTRLNARIEKANYCVTRDDCVYAGLECPFACVPYVNKNEAEELRKAAHEHAKKYGFCDQNCAPLSPPDCVNGRCAPGKGEWTKPHTE